MTYSIDYAIINMCKTKPYSLESIMKRTIWWALVLVVFLMGTFLLSIGEEDAGVVTMAICLVLSPPWIRFQYWWTEYWFQDLLSKDGPR